MYESQHTDVIMQTMFILHSHQIKTSVIPQHKRRHECKFMLTPKCTHDYGNN